MCAVMQVSISGYYDGQNRDQDVSKITAREDLLKKIRASYESSYSTYGSPRITKDLHRQGIMISRPRVARIMKKEGIQSVIRKIGSGKSCLKSLRFTIAIPPPACSPSKSQTAKPCRAAPHYNIYYDSLSFSTTEKAPSPYFLRKA